MAPQGNSNKHLEYFLELLGRREPFALIRPNDGEYMVLHGETLTNIDNWTFKGGSLSEDLGLSIAYAATLKNSYVGVPCPACWAPEKTAWYINKYRIDKDHLTYGYVVCNNNWAKFIDFLVRNRTEINYIGPGTANTDILNVVSRFTISPYLLNEWDAKKEEAAANIDKYVAGRGPNTVFCFSAGPIAKILIPYLYSKYPSSTFIDVGSAFDVFLKGTTNRSYVLNGDHHSKIICDFERGHSAT